MKTTEKNRKLQLLENKLRKMVREELLKEEPKDQDLDYLYKILKSAGPKISEALSNLDKVYNQNQRFQRILKGWNELAFGYGDFYHKVKAGKIPE